MNITEEEGANMDDVSKARTMFTKVRVLKDLEYDLSAYERPPHGDPQQSHATLLGYMWRNIRRKKEQKFELEVNEDVGRRYATSIPSGFEQDLARFGDR